jgi:dTDP-4-dehydrorhamnose 3,5-epimerase
MKIFKSKKLNLKIIYPNTNFKDKRGRYIETFNKKEYKKILNRQFVEDDICVSKRNVFRGIHGDNNTWKLISCVYGKCLSIIINCDRKSKNFGKSEKFILDADKYFQILVPPKFGNSFFVLTKFAAYHYKQTRYYGGKNKQFTFNINDPYFKINYLKNKKLIISNRDKNAKFINE